MQFIKEEVQKFIILMIYVVKSVNFYLLAKRYIDIWPESSLV